MVLYRQAFIASTQCLQHACGCGCSVWDNVTREHRSVHWIVKENAAKQNGQYVPNNRRHFLVCILHLRCMRQLPISMHVQLRPCALCMLLCVTERVHGSAHPNVDIQLLLLKSGMSHHVACVLHHSLATVRVAVRTRQYRHCWTSSPHAAHICHKPVER